MRYAYKNILIGVLLLILGALASWSAFAIAAKPHISIVPTVAQDAVVGVSTSGDIAAQRMAWAEKIERLGAKAAYTSFKTEYQNESFDLQHTAAHLFGSVLYQKVGVSGVAVCDGDFSFGCFHSFFGQAIADQGPEIVSLLDRECTAALGLEATGCQHGIGHGVMEYFGSDLPRALATCKDVVQKQRLFGCTSGVFMEYNVPIIFDATGARIEPRAYDSAHPYVPCTDIAAEFQESCYHELAQWWSNYGRDDYKRLGKLCEDADIEANRISCFMGIGNIASPSSHFVVADTIERCKELGAHERVVVCLTSASWAMEAAPEAQDAYKICSSLSVTERQNCAKPAPEVKGGSQ